MPLYSYDCAPCGEFTDWLPLLNAATQARGRAVPSLPADTQPDPSTVQGLVREDAEARVAA